LTGNPRARTASFFFVRQSTPALRECIRSILSIVTTTIPHSRLSQAHRTSWRAVTPEGEQRALLQSSNASPYSASQSAPPRHIKPALSSFFISHSSFFETPTRLLVFFCCRADCVYIDGAAVVAFGRRAAFLGALAVEARFLWCFLWALSVFLSLSPRRQGGDFIFYFCGKVCLGGEAGR
jgi:hypothetical protein